MNEKKLFLRSLIFPSLFITVIWLIKIAEVVSHHSLYYLGLFPKRFSGFWKIATFPLIHSNFEHLASNSLPILILAPAIAYFYPSAAVKVISISYFLPGALLWFFGRPAYHIASAMPGALLWFFGRPAYHMGASAMIYSFTTFLFFSGIIRRDKRAIALSLIVTFLYGSLVWGVLPLDPVVSWEGHLSGALSGIAAAFLFRKYDPYKKYDWEDEEEEFKN
jgi:membrane associated rhomboid family serine protease